MDIQTIENVGFILAVALFILASMGLVVLAILYLITRANLHWQAPVKWAVSSSRASSPTSASSEVFANGYSRQDYHTHGMNDDAIDYMGLDQPSAPAPGIAGVVMGDMFNRHGGGKM